MTGRWTAGERLFPPPDNLSWMCSHAALPTPIPHADGYRVFFCGRDAQSRARIGYFDTDPDASRVLRVSQTPVLDLGELGAFDDSGCTTSCVVAHEGTLYLYYTGWSLGVTVPFYFFVGLATSRDGGESFQRVSRGPVLERNDVDPYLTASPCVLVEGGLWRMWYVACQGWTLEKGKPKHFYHIRYAESRDGIHWERTGRVCIDFKEAGEYALARPCVRRRGDRYQMWFSARGEAYHTGYAESSDGLEWERRDDAPECRLSPADWDGEMQAYPWVMAHDGRDALLYNGNGYGRTGIGVARWVPDAGG